MQKLVHFVLASILAISCGTDAEGSPAIRITNPSSSITEGEIGVVASPDAVYATLVDYARWPEVFTYFRKASIVSQHGDAAEITILSKKGNTTKLRFRNDSAHRVVRFEQIGGRADVRVEIAVVPGKSAGTSTIKVRLSASVKGAASWFVSDSKVRRKRESRISKDLGLLLSYFDAKQHT